MKTPQEVIENILSQVVDIAACRRACVKRNDDYPNSEAIRQATALLSALTVSRAWNRACLRVAPWPTLYFQLNGNHRRHEGKKMSPSFYRVQVFCSVEQHQLEGAIHRFVADRRLVYRSPKLGRVYDTARLGIRKLKKLGKANLKGAVHKQFVALVRRYEQVHRLYLALEP